MVTKKLYYSETDKALYTAARPFSGDREASVDEVNAHTERLARSDLKDQYDLKKTEYFALYQAAVLRGDAKTAESWQQAYQKANDEYIKAIRILTGINY